MSSTVESTLMRSVLQRVLESAELRRLVDEVRGGARVVSVSGLVQPAARALVLAALQRETGQRLAVVVQANRELEAWERDLCFWSEALRGGEGRSEGQATNVGVLTLPASESD